MKRALPPLGTVFACLVLAASPGTARAYDRQLTLDANAGWSIAPVLAAPNHGPVGGIGTTIGFDDTWGLGVHADWAVHPRFTDAGEPLQIGFFGAEALYYVDIFVLVPFFGLGVDVLTTYDGAGVTADFAVHARASLDYVVSRDVAIGIDFRPYVLLTALSFDPVIMTIQLRVSVLLDY